MLDRLLCKLGLHKWRELYGEVAECDDDFLLRYCLRCGKLQEAHCDFRFHWGEPKSLENWKRRAREFRFL